MQIDINKYKNTAEHVVIKPERPNHQIECKLYQNSKNKNGKNMMNGKIKESIGPPFSGEQREF